MARTMNVSKVEGVDYRKIQTIINEVARRLDVDAEVEAMISVAEIHAN